MWIPDAVLDHVREVTDEPDLSATKYRIVRALGRGGMGAVFAAHDAELDREVAIKVSTGARASGDLCERLRAEARVIARLEHPGIVPVHDVGVLPDGRVYYVMKLVRGERLDEWARGRDVRVVLRSFRRICEAVSFAHAHGVVHRDLKPENVMVGAFGEALVMDWGIAADASRPDPAVAVAVAGTPAYMAPEQARGDVDARADVYSLGAVLSFLVGRDAPKPLASIVRRATAERADDRYASAADLAEDVGRYLDVEPVRAHRESITERVARFATRHRVILSLVGAYVLLRVLMFVFAR